MTFTSRREQWDSYRRIDLWQRGNCRQHKDGLQPSAIWRGNKPYINSTRYERGDVDSIGSFLRTIQTNLRAILEHDYAQNANALRLHGLSKCELSIGTGTAATDLVCIIAAFHNHSGFSKVSCQHDDQNHDIFVLSMHTKTQERLQRLDVSL